MRLGRFHYKGVNIDVTEDNSYAEEAHFHIKIRICHRVIAWLVSLEPVQNSGKFAVDATPVMQSFVGIDYDPYDVNNQIVQMYFESLDEADISQVVKILVDHIILDQANKYRHIKNDR